MKNLLIAAKHLNSIFDNDAFFNQSIVLMLGETTGLILNIKESPYLTDAMPSIIESFQSMHIPNIESILPNIRLGGPTSGPVICLHKIPDLGKEVLPGVYWTYKIEHIRQILVLPNNEYRLYVGSTTWENEDQLKKELYLGAWQQCECVEPLLFESSDKEKVWEKAKKEHDFQFWKKVGIKKPQNYKFN